MALPEPFFVIATQNPQDQAGTFPLPERIGSISDARAFGISRGSSGARALRRLGSARFGERMASSRDVESLQRLQQRVLDIHVAPALLVIVQALVAHTRHAPGPEAGLSPRAAIGLLRAARAWRWIAGRSRDSGACAGGVRRRVEHRGGSGTAVPRGDSASRGRSHPFERSDGHSAAGSHE